MTIPRGVSQGWRRGTRSSLQPPLEAIRIKNSLLEGIHITRGVGVANDTNRCGQFASFASTGQPRGTLRKEPKFLIDPNGARRTVVVKIPRLPLLTLATIVKDALTRRHALGREAVAGRQSRFKEPD